MEFRQLPNEYIINNITYRAYESLEPVVDTLVDWRNNTEVIWTPWRDVEVGYTDSQLTFNGYPLHPYPQRRLIRYHLGVDASTKMVWRDNADILAQAIARAPQLLDADQVQIRVVNGQVVYATELPLDLGHHADYFELMAKHFEEAVKSGRTPMTLVGYLVDPVWVHFRMMYVPRSSSARSHQLGVQLDASYLFTNATRGRASYGLFAYDTFWHSMLTMDNWWSARTPELRSNTADTLLTTFDKRLGQTAPHLRKKAQDYSTSLSAINRRRAPRPWRQKTLSHVGYKWMGMDNARAAVAEVGKYNLYGAVDYAFAWSKHLDDPSFDRRIRAERDLSLALKALRPKGKR